MSYATIISIKSSIDKLIGKQEAVVASFDAAAKNVTSDLGKALDAVDAAAHAIVIADDADRYAALSRAAKDARIGHDFTAIVADWTQKDADNRKERAALEEKWGTRQEVAHKAAEVKEGIELIASALAEISPEIAQFDVTSKKIKDHNEKYKGKPKLQVTPESYENYSKFGWKGVGRFLLWLVGYRGPHRAYKVVSEYSKQFGNYYEDALEIADRRKNEKKLQGEQAAKQEQYDELTGIGRRMATLDGSYRGSQGIARDIGGIIEKSVLASADFVKNLLRDVPGHEADVIALNTLKAASLSTLAATVKTQASLAGGTLQKLNEPGPTLEAGVKVVGNESINFDIQPLARMAAEAARSGGAAAAALSSASDSLELLTAPPNTDYDTLQAMVGKLGSVSVAQTQIAFSFGTLERNVNSEIEAYEAEQRRLAEIERQRIAAEAERERIRLQKEFESVARRTPQVDTTPDLPSYTPSTNIGIGNRGITERGGSSGIGIGSRGISGR